jgi:bifunctional non-homologous end joining protein LigD
VIVRLSNAQKILFPEAGFTKEGLVDYYVRVADALLPHLAGRPVTLRRFPDGIEETGWYQNDCPPGAPEWVRTRRVEWPSGTTWKFCAIDDVATLAWVANLATVELHPFFLRAERPDEPTGVVFDLDPGPPADLVECCAVALRLRELLASLGLEAFPKVSGALGLHIVVPLNVPHSWARGKAFARGMAALLAAEQPEGIVHRQRRSERRGKVLVDWLQNDPTRSTVAPYSLRSYGWPTVSAPVAWDEVERAAAERRADLLVFTPAAALARLDRLGDLFRPVLDLRQRLPAAPS